MMKRAQTVVSFLAAFLLATAAFADAGDAGAADMGAADMGVADAGMDMGTADAGTDMGPIDLGTDDMGGAEDSGSSSDMGGTDGGLQDMGGFDAGPRTFTVSGSAVVSTSEAATVEVVLMPEGGTPITDFTDGAGRFEFRDLTAGTYDITASYQGFVTQSRTVELTRDRRIDFVLFPDVTFTVVIDVTFVDGTGPMTATAQSLGREVMVEGEGPGELEMMLGAGPWDVAVESPGYLGSNLAFNLAPDRDPAEPVKLSAVLERPATPEITSDSGCSCSHSRNAPDGALLLLLAAAGLMVVRRRNR